MRIKSWIFPLLSHFSLSPKHKNGIWAKENLNLSPTSLQTTHTHTISWFTTPNYLITFVIRMIKIHFHWQKTLSWFLYFDSQQLLLRVQCVHTLQVIVTFIFLQKVNGKFLLFFFLVEKICRKLFGPKT